MSTLTKEKKARLIRNTGRLGVLLLTSITFLFALVSGANAEDGFMGIVYNSPNTIPWLIMFGLIAIAWRSEIVGGILLMLYNLVLFFFFTIMAHHFFVAPFVLLCLLILFSSCFIISWYLKWNT